MPSLRQNPSAQRIMQQCRALVPDVTDEALEHAYRACRQEFGHHVEDQEMIECMVHMLTGNSLPGTTSDPN